MVRKQSKHIIRKSANFVDKSYIKVVADIKSRIRSAQYKAVLAANQELIHLYWNIGTLINQHAVWGNKFLQQLAEDIKAEFPGLKGYSYRNLKYMVRFARLFPDILIGQSRLAQITWYHHIALMSKVKNIAEYQWYAEKTVENGWTRNILVHQIETNLYKRQAKREKITNFDRTLPKPQSELALQTLKDPYIFDFIAFREGMLERDIENALTENITNMLLELGEGFAFVGKQYHFEIGKKGLLYRPALL